MKKIKELYYTKKFKMIMFCIFDIVTLVLASYLALALRYEFNIPNIYMNNVLKYIVLDSIILIGTFSIFKLYKSMWTFASIMEIIYVSCAITLYELIEFIYKSIFNINMPKSFFLIQFMILILVVIGIRFSYRLIRTIKIYVSNKNKKIPTMLIGAGEAGHLLINEINRNQDGFDNKIVCIIDDDKNKKGKLLKGIPVLGNRKKIPEICAKLGIKEIIIAIPSAPKDKINIIVEECQKTKLNIKILPQLSELVGKPTMKKVRQLSYEDFLGRNEIVVNSKEIETNIQNQTVLVTGGGGSIGSELCRQIASFNPKQLIIFDIYENNAYEIEQELIRKSFEIAAILDFLRQFA